MKKLAFILAASAALESTAIAHTAADVDATDALNQNAEIRVTAQEVKVTEVGDDSIHFQETVIQTEIHPNAPKE